MNSNNHLNIQHLFARAGFGIAPQELKDYENMSIKKAVKFLLTNAKEDKPLAVVNLEKTEVVKKKVLRNILEMKGLSPELIKESLQENRAQIGELNYQWLNKMTIEKASLRERMTLFWHGHFACRARQALLVQQQNNVIRTNALGNFGDLLLAISKDPAMLQFLNNQQNRKKSPNENFAREVMELFTLGRGNYSEKDVKEAARAFTGWGYDFQGQFVFREKFHDAAEKTFQGKTGNFSGEDILTIILQNPKTATFICTKIYRYFVNDVPNTTIIDNLSQRFYHSGYNIEALMEEIFTSNWFYEPQNKGTRIKSPVELLVGLQKNFNLSFSRKEPVLFIQKALGQVLFYPPNVAGWTGGKNWIDSSTLLTRLRLPENIFKSALVQLTIKDEGDADTDYLSKKVDTLKATIDWHNFQSIFVGESAANVLQKIESFLLIQPLSPAQRALILHQVNHQDGVDLAKNIALMITSMPEYQLN